MKKSLPKLLLSLQTFLFWFSVPALAHEGEEIIETTFPTPTLEDVVRTNSLKVVTAASLLVLTFVVLTILLKDRGEGIKKFLFAGIVLPTLAALVFLAGSTIYLNLSSSSGGPVHWHADFEIYDCGQKLNLVDPTGFSNKIGTSTLHEHNDLRIHVEGVVVEFKEASLGRFFQVIGGEITNDFIQIPTQESGLVVRHNGDNCPDGTKGTLQVFLYKIKNAVADQKTNFVVEQTKLTNFAGYVMSPFSSVPPGDCLIIEFGPEKDRTDKLCESYKLQKIKGNLYGN